MQQLPKLHVRARLVALPHDAKLHDAGGLGTLHDKVIECRQRGHIQPAACAREAAVGNATVHALLGTQAGEEAVDLMRTIKHALDPNNIFNPGKVIRW